MKLAIESTDWVTKTIPVVDKTKMTLKNGRVIMTASNMLRKASKI